MSLLDKKRKQRDDGVILYDTHRSSKEEVEVVVGVDAGSTETRVSIADTDDIVVLWDDSNPKGVYEKLVNDYYVIPSTFAVVGDHREISPNSEYIEDNYDSYIVRVKNRAMYPLVNNERIVRGSKMTSATGLVPRYLDSSTNKMDNTIFYSNVLDGIGYALLHRYNGDLPHRVKVHLILSVRPKELNSFCTTKMSDNFTGEFVFRWKSATITLNIVDALYTTEPEAQIEGTTTIMDIGHTAGIKDATTALDEDFFDSDSYIHIEGGGSSIGVEVVKDGCIVDACSSTFPLGGNYLVRVIVDRLREVKGRTISEESVRNAIQSCLLKNGREREDISDIISSCKNQVGLDIFERLRHSVIDVTADLTFADIDFITLGGRLFNRDDSGNSIGDYFAQYVQQVSPHTQVVTLETNYIPQGNLIIGLEMHGENMMDAEDNNLV